MQIWYDTYYIILVTFEIPHIPYTFAGDEPDPAKTESSLVLLQCLIYSLCTVGRYHFTLHMYILHIKVELLMLSSNFPCFSTTSTRQLTFLSISKQERAFPSNHTGCRQMTRAGHTPDVECCKAVMRSLGAAGE